MVNDVDQNDNGMIEFNEFLQMMSKKMREGDSEDELKEAFKWVLLRWHNYIFILKALLMLSSSTAQVMMMALCVQHFRDNQISLESDHRENMKMNFLYNLKIACKWWWQQKESEFGIGWGFMAKIKLMHDVWQLARVDFVINKLKNDKFLRLFLYF